MYFYSVTVFEDSYSTAYIEYFVSCLYLLCSLCGDLKQNDKQINYKLKNDQSVLKQPQRRKTTTNVVSSLSAWGSNVRVVGAFYWSVSRQPSMCSLNTYLVCSWRVSDQTDCQHFLSSQLLIDNYPIKCETLAHQLAAN